MATFTRAVGGGQRLLGGGCVRPGCQGNQAYGTPGRNLALLA